MKLNLEQRALLSLMLTNFGTGMVFVVLLSPGYFTPMLGYYLLMPAAIILLIGTAKINYDTLKHGVIKGLQMKSKITLVNTEQTRRCDKQ